MTAVTQILSEVEQGDPSAAGPLLPLVYGELRKLAAANSSWEKPGQTLQATALVHEAYLQLADVDKAQHWDSRGHFFSAAAQSMRRILLNRARDKKRLKRGGGRKRIELDNVALALDTPAEELIALDEAIEDLSARDPVSADLVKLCFFAGMSLKNSCAVLGLTRRQGDRRWAYARAWWFDRLRND